MSLLDMKEYFGIYKERWVLIELYKFASLYKEVKKKIKLILTDVLQKRKLNKEKSE